MHVVSAFLPSRAVMSVFEFLGEATKVRMVAPYDLDILVNEILNEKRFCRQDCDVQTRAGRITVPKGSYILQFGHWSHATYGSKGFKI